MITMATIPQLREGLLVHCEGPLKDQDIFMLDQHKQLERITVELSSFVKISDYRNHDICSAYKLPGDDDNYSNYTSASVTYICVWNNIWIA